MELTVEDQGKIEFLTAFKGLLDEYRDAGLREQMDQIRSDINECKSRVRRIIVEAGVFKTYTIGPPPAIGGFINRNYDLFDGIFDAPYGQNVVPNIKDMIDEAIGAIKAGVFHRIPANEDVPGTAIKKGYAFIAMTIDPTNPDLEDVLDAIKAAASDLGIEAERIDDQETNEAITPRIFESIRMAEFVIVDVTHAKPNVFYEAGYAQGIGKTPIFLAKAGTKLEFDIKDYPIKFYTNMRSLREQLQARLEAIAKAQ